MDWLRAFLFSWLALLCSTAVCQEYPTKPIRLITPLAPGGATDVAARLIAEHAGKLLGQPMVVENIAGAGGTIGSNVVARAAPDGYTLLMGTNGTLAIAPAVYSKLPYDSDNAFAPVTLATEQQFVLVVSPTLPVKSLAELIAYAKTPGKLNYGSAGNGSGPHLGMVILNRLAGVEISHIPYKSTGPMVQALLAGDVQVGMPDIVGALPFIQAGRLRPLAVSRTSRSVMLPDVPTVQEAGFAPFDVLSWVGVVAPAGTPPAIIAKLNNAISGALRVPEVRQRLATFDSNIRTTTPGEFAAFIRAERKKWKEAVDTANVRLD